MQGVFAKIEIWQGYHNEPLPGDDSLSGKRNDLCDLKKEIFPFVARSYAATLLN